MPALDSGAASVGHFFFFLWGAGWQYHRQLCPLRGLDARGEDAKDQVGDTIIVFIVVFDCVLLAGHSIGGGGQGPAGAAGEAAPKGEGWAVDGADGAGGKEERYH